MQEFDQSDSSKRHEKQSISVIIPCYNAAKFLPNLIASLHEQTMPCDEIIVVDDGSSDCSALIAQDLKAKVFVHSSNLGVAAARNSACSIAIGNMLVFFDADTLPIQNCIELIMSEFECAEVAGVGGQEIFDTKCDNTIDLWRNFFWRQTHGDCRIESAWMLMGLCSAYRKDALLKINGFDNSYNTNGEDVDIGIRLNKFGYRLIYNPDVGVLHKRTDTLKTMIQMAFRHSFWQSRAMRKNGINPKRQILNAFKWMVVSLGSSLIRHRNLKLTFLSPIICIGAVAGRFKELFS